MSNGGWKMGTFLCEYVNDLHFENEDELKTRLREELLKFGENSVSQINIFDRELFLIRLNELPRPNEDGVIRLEYNRYEGMNWEPTFVNFDEEKFTGIHSWSIGSKIGCRQHYLAMLVARVLCECYSNGTYIVYGDVNYKYISITLAYIGRKYGFNLVEKFIRNRCDLNNFDAMKNECYHKHQFWGTRDRAFYYREFMSADRYDCWIKEMKEEKVEDLENAEKGEKVEYVISVYYLGIRLLYHMLEQDIKELDYIGEAEIYNIMFEYCRGGKMERITPYLENLPQDILKYKEYYYKQTGDIEYLFENIDIIGKCIYFILPDDMTIVEAAQNKFLNNYSNCEDKSKLSEDEKNIAINIIISKKLNAPTIDEKRVDELCENIRYIMENSPVLENDCFYGEEEYLNELCHCTGEPIELSDKVINEINRIFAGERLTDFVSNWKYEIRTTEEIFKKLFDIADILSEKANILMCEKFYYMILESMKDQEQIFRLDLLHYTISNLNISSEVFVANWVIEIDFLYEKYLRGRLSDCNTLLHKGV